MSLAHLLTLTHKYGSNPDYALAGGGNTSWKEQHYLFVKASGYALSSVTEEQFVKMDRAKLAAIFQKTYPQDIKERDSAVLADMLDARCPGEEGKRPSSETILHSALPYSFVLHLHPSAINGMLCSKNGKELFDEMYAGEGLWIEPTLSGYDLACVINEALTEYREKYDGRLPLYIFIRHHGIFTGGTTLAEVDYRMNRIYEKLNARIAIRPDERTCEYDRDFAARVASAIRAVKGGVVSFYTNAAVMSVVSGVSGFSKVHTVFTPEHMIDCGAQTIYIDAADAESAMLRLPGMLSANPEASIIGVRGLGIFTCGKNIQETGNAVRMFNDSVKIMTYAENFGGSEPMPQFLIEGTANGEMDIFRRRIQTGEVREGRMSGKVCLITGAASGVGRGLARELAGEGAFIIASDINADVVRELGEELNTRYGKGAAISIPADITVESQVRDLIYEGILSYGGIDVLITNSNHMRYGGVEDVSLEEFEQLTKFNYTSFYILVKYISRFMKIENRFNKHKSFDIIQINSKDGLAGSDRNFVYSGGKSGGLGLIQSFALELLPYGIKVNAICPGSLFDSPLWSDAETGLFMQYLHSGHVPGASSVQDVKSYFENQIPMKRGCTAHDVAVAALYIIDQQYETGQAIPVTGGLRIS